MIVIKKGIQEEQKMSDYTANAGQTYLPVRDNINVDFMPFEKPAKPEPLLPPLVLRQDYVEKGYVLSSQKQHYLPGVTAEMMDWFWANMEKGYYLWAPGSHKRFSWVKTPAMYGIEHSVHMIAEVCKKGNPVFGGDGIEICRLPIAEFCPFTDILGHVICEGVFNEKNEMVDSTVHMWEDVPGGINHITATVTNSRCSEPPAFIKELLAEHPDAVIIPNYATDHEDYEASQWPVFLPGLYALWKDHPDPSQNVRCCLAVCRTSDGGYRYAEENGPVRFK